MTSSTGTVNAVRRIFFYFLVIVLILGGCATTTPPPSPEVRMKMGRVGVFATPSSPRVEFKTFAKGWASGVMKGGAVGVADGFLNALIETSQHTMSGPYAGAASLIVLIVMTTVSTTVHGVAGGMQAVSAKTATDIEDELKGTLGGVSLANILVDEIYSTASTRPDLRAQAFTRLDISSAGPGPSFEELSSQGADTAVSVEITEAGFRGGSGKAPVVSFYLNARIRLLDAAGEVYSRDFQYLSQPRPFQEWFSEGSTELLSGFKEAMAELGGRIVDELFLVTEFPFASGLWALPGTPEFGSCWFYPLSPELDYTTILYSIRHRVEGIQIIYTPASSTMPELAWEPFPRPRDRSEANEKTLSEISGVTYDLKIWRAENDFPASLVYDISGLGEPRHRPSQALKPKTKYFWTFRARYNLAGQPRVTRWAFSNIPSNVPSEYPLRRPGGNCDLDAIPSTNYFRFITP